MRALSYPEDSEIPVVLKTLCLSDTHRGMMFLLNSSNEFNDFTRVERGISAQNWVHHLLLSRSECRNAGSHGTRHFKRASLTPYLGVATLALAIFGVALRTIQDGLGIAKDIERYRDYRGKVRRSLLYFEETTDQHRKLQLMEEMEIAIVDELKGFLRTHRDAAFIL